MSVLSGYRTYLAALIVFVLGALEAVDWVRFLEDPRAGLQLLGAALLMAVMRWLTELTKRRELDVLRNRVAALQAELTRLRASRTNT